VNVPELKYPLEQHKKVLAELVGYYREYPGVYAVVLTGSLARGKAVKDARATMLANSQETRDVPGIG
jgi:predicted nucleotidyltransferase